MLRFLTGLLVLAWATAAAAAEPARPAPPPLSAYGDLPAVEAVALSPSGRRMAFVTVVGADRVLMATELSGNRPLAALRVGDVKVRAVRFADDDFDILLIGHEGHEEVVGTSGEAPDHITLVDGPDDVDNITVRDPEKVVWLSQTTLSVDETMETVRRLRERFPALQDPPSDDICYATQNRQLAVKEMAPQCDLMIVVGSRNSSNSVRLVEVALDHGARAGHLVDYADEIDEAWLDGVSTVGVTSGASVPEILVREVLAFLADRGFGEPETVVAAEESLTFALPNEIRRDLRAAGLSDKMTHDAAAATDGITDPLH